MSSYGLRAVVTGNDDSLEKTYFEEQRTTLLGEIANSLEHVLQNINKLNRSLEGVIAVGNEFGSVEALWSQFESVMVKDSGVDDEGTDSGGEGADGRGDGDGGAAKDASQSK